MTITHAILNAINLIDDGNSSAARDVLEALRLDLETPSRPPRSWEPAPSARARAHSNAQVLDIDIHIDRYLLRCRDRDMKPTNGEWLRWFLDDEQKARTEQRREESEGGTDVVGVPKTWH